MFISNILDQVADRLDNVDWKQLTKKAIKAWDFAFKIIVITMILTYLAFKAGVSLVYRLNDWLAHHWVRLIVPPTPLMEEEENEEDEAPLPAAPSPTPVVIPDPWDTPIEVELMLPLALEPLAILFTTPLMLAATQAPVALLAAGQEVAQPPAPAKRRRRRATQKT